MASPDSTLTNARARRAVAIRNGDTAAAELAARDLTYGKLERAVAAAVAAAPPLTADQRLRCIALLSGGAA